MNCRLRSFYNLQIHHVLRRDNMKYTIVELGKSPEEVKSLKDTNPEKIYIKWGDVKTAKDKELGRIVRNIVNELPYSGDFVIMKV